MPIALQPHEIPGTDPQLGYLSSTPATPPIAKLAILHGYGDHAGRYLHFMQWMADRGIACHALDFRGHGRSAGKFGFVRRWDEYLDDLAKFLAVEELSSPITPLFVLGHSHGGLVAAAAGERGTLNQCAGVILASPYFKLKMPVPLSKRFFASIASRIYPGLQVTSGLNPAMVTRDEAMKTETRNDSCCRGIATPRWFFETRKAQAQIRTAVNQFNLPLLMLVPGDDAVADAAASVLFFEQCKSADKTVLLYPEHRHELLRELGRTAIFADICNWITHRIGVSITNPS